MFKILFKLKTICFNTYGIIPCGVAIILQQLQLMYLTNDEIQTLEQNWTQLQNTHYTLKC